MSSVSARSQLVSDRAGPAVEVTRLRKDFSRRRGLHRQHVTALEPVSFEIARGECVAILGQNGSGKSTLVRLLSTLLLEDGGGARIFGLDVFREPRRVQRLINRVSVEASFFKRLSAIENLSYAARFYGLRRRDTGAEIPRILERVGFPLSRAGEPMEDLSRGMQQKVALARALLTSPALLLLDEPTTGLDPRSKLEVQEFIREVRRVHDATILLCTHDLAEAEELADRIGILHRGRLLCLAPAAELKQRYRTETLEGAFFAATGTVLREEEGDGMIRGSATALRSELMGLSGIVERNTYIIRRYIWWELAWFVWTLANTLTIVFIAKGFAQTGAKIDVNKATSWLLIGALVWSYLGMVFGLLVEMVQWERWEGTIEHTFMAPLSRSMHLLGTGLFAVLYGLVRTAALFAVVALFFHLELPHANYLAALVVLLVGSVSFIGIGMMTSVLPLISPEKGVQIGYVAQGVLLVVSGVYYNVSVLPGWMQALARISPATYALRALRSSIIDGASLNQLWGDIWPLILIGILAVPLGLWIFRIGERYAKRHGKLKRSG